MIIKPEHFENNGEVDITAHYREGKKIGRVSIRRRNGKYELYVHWYFPKGEEDILYSGALKECVDVSNARFGMDDVVDE